MLLMPTRPDSSYYPALIESRNDLHATLRWFRGNIYKKGEKPRQPTLQVHIQQCAKEFRYQQDWNDRPVCCINAYHYRVPFDD